MEELDHDSIPKRRRGRRLPRWTEKGSIRRRIRYPSVKRRRIAAFRNALCKHIAGCRDNSSREEDAQGCSVPKKSRFKSWLEKRNMMQLTYRGPCSRHTLEWHRQHIHLAHLLARNEEYRQRSRSIRPPVKPPLPEGCCSVSSQLPVIINQAGILNTNTTRTGWSGGILDGSWPLPVALE